MQSQSLLGFQISIGKINVNCALWNADVLSYKQYIISDSPGIFKLTIEAYECSQNAPIELIPGYIPYNVSEH